jgi:tetratricopeptide (TPR) repeat protein/transcriptional regulator with XRE-family HTH domain
MAEPPSAFREVLRELRARAGLTQQELAEAAGLGVRTVSYLESGAVSSPQKHTMEALADALGLIGPERARFEAAARGRAPAEGPTATAAAMRSLPRDVATFTGRQQELQQLAESAATAGGVVSIHAIGGMAGVGKTAFAVHAAHHLAGEFPGGQVFLQMHGHTPGRAPVDPADALASLLLVTGVPPGQVPAEMEARAALWRDRAAGQRVMLILDDAVSSDQVQPLLPGSGGSLVMVTSRRHLSALDDATAISLDTLPPAEAAGLLIRLAGRAGLDASDPGVAPLARLCGYLPLAVGMVARQLRHHPAWSVAGRAAELAAARDRLALMQTENLSVAAAFDLSYADLAPEQQRLFRRLGLHPGADIDEYAAAALNGTDLNAARQGLEALYDQYLLTEPAPGRYRLHDLIREHARALASRADMAVDRDAATGRLLNYYQHASAAADARLRGRGRPGRAADDGGTPAGHEVAAAVPALADADEALAWARAERSNLLACLDHAAGAGLHARVVALTEGISGLLGRDGPWADAVARHTAAVRAARLLGDRLGEANALSDLGDAQRLLTDLSASRQALEEALSIYRELGDRAGQASVLSALGAIRQKAGDYSGSARILQEALGICRELDDRAGQARILAELGTGLRMAGDYPAATQALEEALCICRDLGDRLGQAQALNLLGAVQRRTGDYPAAAQAHEEVLLICRDLGHRHGQANALTSLGETWRLMGKFPAAARVLEEALGIYRELGARLGQFNALQSLGSVLRVMGEYPAAGHILEEALVICRDADLRGSEFENLSELGAVHLAIGELGLAERCYRQSLELAREIHNPWGEATALAGLGRCARAADEPGRGETLLRQALEIFQRIGAAEAPDLSAELAALTGPGPAQ